ncbi:hypothetical protein Cgig2_032550 [Carnegiea gigantea]|uniref:CRM domain-containing protein n=1 Tax=Carnegiea gigantea TaxID=171969 RepID=A0A9Q1KXL6_9CARY|nr:hypothetical protein Cgig2_032550 [Carnegiea gigantea]
MAASSVAAATHLLFRRLLLRPLGCSIAAPFSLLRRPKLCFSNNLPSHSLSFSSSFPVHCTISTSQPQFESGVEHRDDELELDEREDQQSEEIENDDEIDSKSSGSAVWAGEEREVPNLTVKEKKELGSYANSLGDKLKSQQVGKSGVTENVVLALNETLEKNELLKLRIHRTCPGELEDVVSLLERATGSAAVFQIGRIVIFYRPSLTKMKAEEKKAQARRLFAQKREKARAAFMMKRREQTKRPGSNRKFERAPS